MDVYKMYNRSCLIVHSTPLFTVRGVLRQRHLYQTNFPPCCETVMAHLRYAVLANTLPHLWRKNVHIELLNSASPSEYRHRMGSFEN